MLPAKSAAGSGRRACSVTGCDLAEVSFVQARAGLKVFARMTKDRVGLKKDQKLGKSRIEIYPVRTRDSVNTLSSPARRP